MSGRQLFTIDEFRDTGRPLLAVLAEPNSIFISGLKRFQRRTLYSNIVNDRSAVYYTTGIAKTDPFAQLSDVKLNYVEGYENVILDPDHPVAPRPKGPTPLTLSSLVSTALSWLRRIPLALAFVIFVPIGIVGFLLNSCIQTVRSSSRIRLHEKGLAGVVIDDYRGFPLWINEIRTEVENAYEALNSFQAQEYLASDTEDDEDHPPSLTDDPATARLLSRERRMSIPGQPTLALAPYQFSMVQALDAVGWRKYPVYIHLDRHSHAAIIVRWEKKTFSEGKVVLRHWLKEEFLI